jgi:tetratricopeptide (TPR) repeat protein
MVEMYAKVRSFINTFFERYFSTNKQVERIIIFAGFALVLAVGSFAGYYYFDRYYSNQQPVSERSVYEAEQAVKDNPTDLNTRLVLAETYLFFKRYDDALTQASQVFVADPTRERVWLVIGLANALNGKPADAISHLTNYVNAFMDEEMPGLDKELQEAAYYLGDSYLQLGQPGNAILPLEQTVGWNQMDADAIYKLGLAYAGVGRYEDAVNMFASAVNFVPDFSEAYQAMAEVYDAGNKPELGDYARGMLAYSQKDYSTALELLLNAKEVYPNYAPIFVGLGLTYEAKNDLKYAKASFDTANSIDPNNYTAARGIERLAALLNQ